MVQRNSEDVLFLTTRNKFLINLMILCYTDREIINNKDELYLWRINFSSDGSRKKVFREFILLVCALCASPSPTKLHFYEAHILAKNVFLRGRASACECLTMSAEAWGKKMELFLVNGRWLLGNCVCIKPTGCDGLIVYEIYGIDFWMLAAH